MALIQVRRQPGGQPPLRIPITKESQTIKLAATLGTLDMGLYGVSPSIAATMDKAVKVNNTTVVHTSEVPRNNVIRYYSTLGGGKWLIIWDANI